MNHVIEILTIGLLGFLAGFCGLHLSKHIQTEDGEFYDFSTFSKWLGGSISGVLSISCFIVSEDLKSFLFLIPIFILFSIQMVIDINYHELADEWNLLLFFLVGINFLFTHRVYQLSHLVSFGFIVIWFGMLWLFTNGLGMGDLKFMIATSLLLTLPDIFPFVIITFGIASICGFANIILSKKVFKRTGWKQEFAFGPFLVIGMSTILLTR